MAEKCTLAQKPKSFEPAASPLTLTQTIVDIEPSSSYTHSLSKPCPVHLRMSCDLYYTSLGRKECVLPATCASVRYRVHHVRLQLSSNTASP